MSVIAHRKNTAIASLLPAIVGFLRKAIRSGTRLLMHVVEVIAEARHAQGGDRGRALSQPLQALVQERRRSADRPLAGAQSNHPLKEKCHETCRASLSRNRVRDCPLFLIGKDSRGNWVVQDQQGNCGGLFVNRAEALKFAMFENGNRPQAVIMVPGIFELDMSGKAGPERIARHPTP